MIQYAILCALDKAILAKGDELTALNSLKALDPLLRGIARHRLQTFFRKALLATDQPSETPEGIKHILQLSYLFAAKKPPTPDLFDQVDAIKTQYQTLRQTRKKSTGKKFWWPSALLLCLLLGIGFWGATLFWDFGKNAKDALQRPAPPPMGAFAKGGVPEEDPVLKEAFRDSLPNYLIALDRWAELARKRPSKTRIAPLEETLLRAEEKLLTNEVKEALGKKVLEKFQEVLRLIKQAAIAPPEQEQLANDNLLETVGSLNDEMAAAALAYFFDADVMTHSRDNRRMVVLYVFWVKRVQVFASGETVIRALRLIRLDQLNIVRSLLGFTRPQLREALIVLEQVEELLVNYILPALAIGAKVPLVDEEEQGRFAWQETLETRAGEMVRQEYGALLNPLASELGKNLLTRQKLFATWQKSLQTKGIFLQVPNTLDDSHRDYQTDLKELVPEEELSQLALVSEALKTPENLEILQQAKELLIASIERHEVQHRLDYMMSSFPLPYSLEVYVGPSYDASGEENSFARQSKYELSAYLSELSRDTLTPRVGLTLIARFLLNRRLWGTSECYAALVIFEEFSKKLSIEIDGPLVESSFIMRERVATLYLELLNLDPDILRKTAKEIWEDLFQSTLPPLEKISQ